MEKCVDRVLELLQEIRPDSNFRISSDFIGDHLLDSFDIVQLTTRLEDDFHIRIDVEDIAPENFQSIDSIMELIRKCGGTV